MATTLGQKAVGSIVKLNESGSPVEFIVVHQGSPSSAYVGFENGVILLRKDIHSEGIWDSSDADYRNSSIHAWGNGTYLNLLDADIRNAILTVRIPYVPNEEGNISQGIRGLQCKIFFLSNKEVDAPNEDSLNEGAVFSYFSSGGNSKRIAKYNNVAKTWWLRSPLYWNWYGAFYVKANGTVEGNVDGGIYSNNYGYRPAFVLPASLYVSDDNVIMVNVPPTAPGSIDVTNVYSNQAATITLTAATDEDGTVESYRYERQVDGGSWQQFADVNSLTQTDSVSGDWGTVAYRACAVDNAGEAGPYATSETETVNSGWVTIGGPDSALGQRIKPFTLSATVNVTGATGTPSLTVTCALDGKQVSSQSITAGSEASIFVDTRVLATGQHTIQMTAEASDYLPANKAWQFSVPMDELPDGGRAEQLWDENQNPIFPRTTSQQVIGKNGLSVQNDLDNMEKRFRGLTGHLEPVDAVLLGTAGAQTELPRESGVHYCFGVYSSAGNTDFTMVLVPAGINTASTLDGNVGVTPSADKFTVVLNGSNAAIVQYFKFVTDAEANVTTNPVALFTALDQPHVLSASGGTSTTVTDQTDALQTIIDENPNANYYILEDTDGNKYYVASSSIINASTASFTGPCYQDDQATTLYSGRTLNLVNTSDVPGLFTALSNTVYNVTTQGTAVSSGSNLNETLLAMIEAQPTWHRYAIPGSGGTTYYVLSQSAIGSDATSAASVHYCTASGTYYTGGTLSFAKSIDTLAVGDTIKIKENGTQVEFKIIHKGSPSAAYIGFDNGVVVLRQDIHSEGIYDSSNNDYANSDIHAWGNGDYLNSIDENVRNKIVQVKIPYRAGTSGSTVSEGENGLQCKVFFLSAQEVNGPKSTLPEEGTAFSYFAGGGNTERIAQYNGEAAHWWLRSPITGSTNTAGRVTSYGIVAVGNENSVKYGHGRRPAFVLPNTIVVTNDGTVIG